MDIDIIHKRVSELSSFKDTVFAQIEKFMEEVRGLRNTIASNKNRIDAVEKSLTDLHTALSDKPAPVGVQNAVADVEVPEPKAKEEKPK